jgi:hypothetical protein
MANMLSSLPIIILASGCAIMTVGSFVATKKSKKIVMDQTISKNRCKKEANRCKKKRKKKKKKKSLQ